MVPPACLPARPRFYLKASAFGILVSAIGHILLLLFEKWHVTVLCAVAYQKVTQLWKAEFVMVR